MIPFNKIISIVFIFQFVLYTQVSAADSTHVNVVLKKTPYGGYRVLLKKKNEIIDSLSVLWAQGFGNIKPVIYEGAVFYVTAVLNTSYKTISFHKCPFSNTGFLEDKSETCMFINRQEYGEFNISRIAFNSKKIKIYYYEGYKQSLPLTDDFLSKLCLALPKVKSS